MLRLFFYFLLLTLTTNLVAQEYENYLNLTEHTAEVQNIRFSPTGDVLASASFDNTAMVWEMPSGKLQHKLVGHSDVILEVSFSPDAKYLATASRDGSVKIWNLTNGKLKATFYNRPFYHRNGDIYKAITFVVFSHDGKYIYFAGKSAYLMRARVDKPKEKPKEILNINTDFEDFKTITGACLSKDGKLLFLSVGHSILIISLQSGKIIKTITYPHALLNDVIAEPEQNMLTYWAEDGNVVLVNYLKGETIKKLKVTTGGKENYSAISYSQDGKFLITGAWQNEARIWDWEKGELLTVLEGHTRLVRACKFSNKNIIATASYDHTIKLWRKKQKQNEDALVKSKNIQIADNQPFIDEIKRDTVLVYKNTIIRDTIYVYLRDTIYVKESLRASLDESDLKLDATINLKGIRFERGTAIFLAGAYPELEALYTLMRKYQNMEIELGGHTDNVGVKTLLLQLSKKRIEKVKAYLLDRGVQYHRIKTKAYGGTSPINKNNNEETRQLNRRVEVTILKL